MGKEAIVITAVLVGGTVGMAVVAALAPVAFSAIYDLNTQFQSADVGDATANAVANTLMPLALGVAGLFMVAAAAFLVLDRIPRRM